MDELSKDRKEAYKQLTKMMDGRKEGDIGVDDEYWSMKRAVQKAEATNYFNPDVVPTRRLIKPLPKG